MYKKVTEQNLLPDRNITVNGVNIPLYLIGDSAYSLQSWHMKPFTHNTALTYQQKTFNYRLCSVVENAYGRLKARWRRLMRRNDMCIDNIPTVVTCACILHNVCEIHGESFNDAWLREVEGNSVSSTYCKRKYYKRWNKQLDPSKWGMHWWPIFVHEKHLLLCHVHIILLYLIVVLQCEKL